MQVTVPFGSFNMYVHLCKVFSAQYVIMPGFEAFFEAVWN